MKGVPFRFGVFLVVILLATALAAQVENPDPNGGGSGAGNICNICSMDAWRYQNSGAIFMTCASPAPGNMGLESCWIDSYPEGSYCFTAGDACCVD